MSFELLARVQRLEQRVTYLEARLTEREKPQEPRLPPRPVLTLPKSKSL